jgi:hypothetical protein
MSDANHPEWTHKALVRHMMSWLKHHKKMTVVCAELTTRNSETPDVIGWGGGAKSILIECKVSRADFRADAKKWFRLRAECGMGDLRYVAAPAGLLCVDEMPEGWGLLEVTSTSSMFRHQVHVTKEAAELQQGNKRNECVMLMSALRRLEIATAVYVVAEADNAVSETYRVRDELIAYGGCDGGPNCWHTSEAARNARAARDRLFLTLDPETGLPKQTDQSDGSDSYRPTGTIQGKIR